MAVMTETIPVSQLAEQAREVRFGRTLATVIAGFFWAIGWAFGHAWYGLVLCALAVRLGFRDGAGRTARVPGAEEPPGSPRLSKL